MPSRVVKMWTASRPSISVREVVEACISGIQDEDKAQRLRSSIEELEESQNRIGSLGADDDWHRLNPKQCLPEAMTEDEMVWFYDRQLSKEGRPARKYYDKILLAAPQARCCYCQHGDADTLDHVFPKREVHGLAIEPNNLVPACLRCNKKLGKDYSLLPEECVLHPYFMPGHGRWLHSRVIEKNPVALEFWAEPEPELDDILQERIRHQFRQLRLGELFGRVSATDLAETTNKIRQHLLSLGEEPVRAELLEMAKAAFEADVNSRRGAMFEALAASNWYCRGGALSG